MLAMTAVVGMTGRAESNVTVYVENGLNTDGALYQAQSTAAKAFASIGVRILGADA